MNRLKKLHRYDPLQFFIMTVYKNKNYVTETNFNIYDVSFVVDQSISK